MNGDYSTPATSRLIRGKITVSVSNWSNRSIQQPRQALSDTQDNRARDWPHVGLCIYIYRMACKTASMECPSCAVRSRWNQVWRSLYLRLAVEACRDYETGGSRVVLMHERQHVGCDASKAGQVVRQHLEALQPIQQPIQRPKIIP